MEPPVCRNIRSRRHPDQRCKNPAIYGEYCGIHLKHPHPFEAKFQNSITESPIQLPQCKVSQIRKVQRWWKFYGKIRIRNRQGPARWAREISNNKADFYSMDEIATISGEYLFSYFEKEDRMVYSFDIRSFSCLIEKYDEKDPPQNPYTRISIKQDIIKKAMVFIRWCRKKGISTRWAPIEPPTPDQRFRLKVTDLFQKIDELNYYTNPEWFVNMSVDNHRCFYIELFDIWYHRAELSDAVRRLIIPLPARPFRFPVKEVVIMRPLEILRKINLDLIRMFITAADSRSDNTTGAMYVITAMTLVSEECAMQYPWLYESAIPGIYDRYRQPVLQLVNFYNTILGEEHPITFFQMTPPELLLPPPALPPNNN